MGRVCKGIDTAARFWMKVDRQGPDECWPWLASVNRGGYGTFTLDGRKIQASRAVWILTFGNPGDLWVLHRCDNPICVNPSHLFLGTNLDNIADRVAKGRNADRRGERNTAAKLCVADVIAMRQQYEGGVRLADLSREYGLAPGGAWSVVNYRTWNAVGAGRGMR